MGTETLALPDGRTLGFACSGAADGTPVLYFHGAVGSSLDRCDEIEALVARVGVRWIVVQRPGFGASCLSPGRSLDAWPRDIGCLADALGLGELRIVGVSAGAPYALAAAARLGARVRAVAAVSALGPPPRLDPLRLVARTALRVAPGAVAALGDQTLSACAARPELFLRLGGRGAAALPGAA